MESVNLLPFEKVKPEVIHFCCCCCCFSWNKEWANFVCKNWLKLSRGPLILSYLSDYRLMSRLIHPSAADNQFQKLLINYKLCWQLVNNALTDPCHSAFICPFFFSSSITIPGLIQQQLIRGFNMIYQLKTILDQGTLLTLSLLVPWTQSLNKLLMH
jgi:hypothetical protein